MAPQYTNANHIAETPLAGCLPVVEDINNFELLRDNLADRIACYYYRPRAYALRGAIMLEAEKVNIPVHEYVINELQYEFRLAKVHGQVDRLNQEEEADLISRWARHIIRKKDVDTSLEFITALKANRLKRVR